ncbi:MAG: hypothetical protein DI585_06605 [Pseudomonas fluorescens]|nr:MAG: hypothetical protein DI585_06605 [Pseudomonas fluorescens]
MQPTPAEHLKRALVPHIMALMAAFGGLFGAGAFFLLPFNPPVITGLLVLGIALIFSAFAFNITTKAIAIFTVMFGLTFSLATWQTGRVQHVNFAASSKPHWVVGTVTELAENPTKPNRVTVLMNNVELYGLGPNHIKTASIGVFKSQIEDLAVGQGVAISAALLPPEPPKYNGQRDSRLWKYFNDTRITGYSMGGVESTYHPAPPKPLQYAVLQWVEDLRTTINTQTASMAQGAVTALLTGDESAVPPKLREAYIKTGLSHLLAISGMQLTIVALGLFWIFAALLARIPNLALHTNVRIWAAVMSLSVTLFYTFLAGAAISLVRASLMSAIVLGAIIFGRMSNAVRGWCAAVIVIMLVNPLMVTRAGFLLSITAVLALLLLAISEEPVWKGGKLTSWLRGLVLATIVAGAATAPVLVGYFGQFSAISMFANIIAVPVMAVATYLGMLALAVWPLGFQDIPLRLMTATVEIANNWAYLLEKQPYSYVSIPKYLWMLVAPFALLTLSAAYTQKWKTMVASLVGLTLIPVAIAMLTPKPDVLIWDGGAIGLYRTRGEVFTPLWADSLDNLTKTARYANVELTGLSPDIPKTVDESFMPVTEHEHFAWAERRAGKWLVQPISCVRPWQKTTEACW